MIKPFAILLLTASLAYGQGQLPDDVLRNLLMAAGRPVASGAASSSTNFAYNFNGTTTKVWNYPVPSAANTRIWGSAAITLSAWCCATGLVDFSNFNTVFSTRNGDTAKGFTLNVTSGGFPAILDRQGGSTTTSTVAIVTGTWNHIVWSHTNGSQRIYLNGVLTGTNSYAQTYSAGFCVSGAEYSGGGGYSGYWKGRIAEMELWDRILASNEVYDLYNGGVGIVPTNNVYPFNTNCVCIWNYQENAGTQMWDSGSVGLTGYVVTGSSTWTNAPQPYR